MMVDQAAVMKRIAPETKVWIYRNLVQPYANFRQFREKLEDPAYAGWFVPFGPNNSEKLTPRCELNPRLNKTLCSDLFHTRLAWTEDGHDCGDVIPCGDYVFDHRNQSLREWIVKELMMGPMGMGNRSAVDGFLIDDWWTLEGPSEVPYFAQGTGLAPNSTANQQLYGNWSLTTWEALAAVHAAGGYTWSNINCELDPFYFAGEANYSSKYLCGLTKTNGSPRANNIASAPVWDGRKGNDQEKGETGKLGCAEWLREACSPDSVFGRIPTLLSFTASSTPRRPHGGDPFPALKQDVARFLLVRNNYSWMGYGWEGCIHTPPPVTKYDAHYGTPLGRCAETAAGSGVFTRRYTNAKIAMDCNSFTANITVLPTPALGAPDRAADADADADARPITGNHGGAPSLAATAALPQPPQPPRPWLDLAPAPPPARQAFRNNSLQSWGITVMESEEDGQYHAFVDTLSNNCGLGSWITNSQIIHATSDAPTGPFAMREVVLPP
eukprot:g2224.t1